MTNPSSDAGWQTLQTSLSSSLQPSSSSTKKPYSLPETLTSTIDHTLLKLDATPSQIDTLCSEALAHSFATVCVRPNYVKRCVTNLQGSGVKVAAVVGFHEGTYTLEEKLRDLSESVEGGAGGVGCCCRLEGVEGGEKIYEELVGLRKAAPLPVLQKLILETSQLADDEILAGAVLAHAAGFDFIKTATGFHGHGATVEHVQLMKAACEGLAESPDVRRVEGQSKEMKVKASGGVRSLDDARRMLEVGASRLGTSAGVVIAEQAKGEGSENGSGRVGQEGGY